MNANRVTVVGGADVGVFGEVTEDPPEVPPPRKSNWKIAMIIAKLSIIALKVITVIISNH